MATKTTTPSIYSPQELKTLFEALNQTPGFLSKRFVLKYMCGFSEESIKENSSMIEEENNLRKQGFKGVY